LPWRPWSPTSANDLDQFGVTFERWFSERSLESSGALERAIARLEREGWLYKQDGATWFKASELGDDKDRVVIRENGRTTYFASDVAYLLDKLERCPGTSLYIFGADHHGYVPRLKAAARGLDEDPDRLDFQLVQFAMLFRGGKKVQMSTRSGSFVTLRELREEVGNDAARYFYVMRSHEQHLDFDLDLAKSRASENPVYYIQYAHARIASVFRQLEGAASATTRPLARRPSAASSPITSRSCCAPWAVSGSDREAARKRAPHILAHYLHDLAPSFMPGTTTASSWSTTMTICAMPASIWSRRRPGAAQRPGPDRRERAGGNVGGQASGPRRQQPGWQRPAQFRRRGDLRPGPGHLGLDRRLPAQRQ
jgi:arginyl-tRNA synthetase